MTKVQSFHRKERRNLAGAPRRASPRYVPTRFAVSSRGGAFDPRSSPASVSPNMADGARSNFHGTQWTCAELAAVMPITEGVSWSCGRPTWVPGASSWSARQRDTEAAEPGFCRRRVAASAPSERASERARASRPWRGPPMLVCRCWTSDRSRRMRPARSSAWFHGRGRWGTTGSDWIRADPTRPEPTRSDLEPRGAGPGAGLFTTPRRRGRARRAGRIGSIAASHRPPEASTWSRGLTVLLLSFSLSLSLSLPISPSCLFSLFLFSPCFRIRPRRIDRPDTGDRSPGEARIPREAEYGSSDAVPATSRWHPWTLRRANGSERRRGALSSGGESECAGLFFNEMPIIWSRDRVPVNCVTLFVAGGDRRHGESRFISHLRTGTRVARWLTRTLLERRRWCHESNRVSLR